MAGETLTKVSLLVNHPPCRPQVDDVTVMMHVVGSVKELGNWDVVHSKRMRKGNDGGWEISLYLPKATEVQYQYVLKDFDDRVVWQGQKSRSHFVMDRVNGFSVVQQLKDHIFSDESAEPRSTVRTPRGMHISSESLLGKLEPTSPTAQTKMAPSMLARGVTPNRHRSVPSGNKDCVPLARPQNVMPRHQSVELPSSVAHMMSRVGDSQPPLVPPAEKKETKILEPLREEDEKLLSVGTPKPSAEVSEIVPVPETPPTVEKLQNKERKEGDAESLTAESKELVKLAMKQKSAPNSAAKKKKHRRSARNNDMRHNFMNFLEREADRKQQTLTTLKRRTLDVDDEEELEKLNSTCSSLSQELSDLDELLLDTREAVVVEAMERLEAQKQRREQKEKREEERLAALARTEASEAPSPPPPLHHRAASLANPPKPPALGNHLPGPATVSGSHLARDFQGAAPARRSVPAAVSGPMAPAPWLNMHSVDRDSRSSGSSYCPPRGRAARAREAYCNTVTKRIAKPVVGPVDRMLGRMSKWVYGDAVEQCRASQSASREAAERSRQGSSGQGGGKYTSLMKMCCTVDQDVLGDLSKTSVFVGEEERRMLQAVAEIAAQSQRDHRESERKAPAEMMQLRTPVTTSAIVV